MCLYSTDIKRRFDGLQGRTSNKNLDLNPLFKLTKKIIYFTLLFIYYYFIIHFTDLLIRNNNAYEFILN